MDYSLFWIPATLIAAIAQTGRNAAQSNLTRILSPIGAAHIRFLYALPFACIFLPVILYLTGEPLPDIRNLRFFSFICLGSVLQVTATALMLWAMEKQSFSVVTAIMKTEPVQIALFAVIFLHEHFPLTVWIAIFIATAGVLVTVMKPGKSAPIGNPEQSRLKAVLAGILAGAFFAFTTLAFQVAIRELTGHSAFVQASTSLVASLFVQTIILFVLMLVFKRPALIGSFKLWRSSLGVGFLGAAASQFWFIAFALASAANVRTLGLVEVLVAYFVSRRLLHQDTSRQEIAGMILIVLGVGLMLWAQANIG